MRRKAAVLLYPGCIFFEIALAAQALAGSMDVDFYTPQGTAHRSSTGAVVYPSGSYEDAESVAGDFAVVLVPGGDPGSIIPSSAANAVLQSSRKHGAVVGGICGGVLVLASAGILVGRKVTHNYTAEFAGEEVENFTSKYWEGSIYERADVVIDHNVISAMPWAYAEFAGTVAVASGAMSVEHAWAFVSQYLQCTDAASMVRIQAAFESVAQSKVLTS